MNIEKTFYRILTILAAFGAVGAAYIGLQFVVSGSKTDDIQNALLPAFVALPCAALAFFAYGKATAIDSPTK